MENRCEEINRKQANKIVLTCLLTGYVLFNLFLLIMHEPWRDEANVWLMARELSPIALFREIKYQGHPCLWYLLVMPFAKAGMPFRTIEVLSFFIMTAGAWLFLWKAPFHIITKAALLFSPIFTYFYPVIARNYCLIALLLIVLAWQFPQRNVHCVRYGILLGLLVQADTIAIAEAGLISAMWLFEGLWQWLKSRSFRPFRRVLAGIWIPAASLGLWFLQFWQVSDSPQYSVREMGMSEFVREVRNFAYGILIRMTGRGQGFCLCFMAISVIVLLIISIKLKNGWAAVVMTGTFLFQAVFSAVVYQLHMWHYISLGFVLIWAVWVLVKQTEEKAVPDKINRWALKLLELLLIVLSVCMFINWNSEKESSNLDHALRGLYSDGENVAEYIKENIPADELIVTTDVPMASTIAAYLRGYEFYYAGNRQIETYADWSEEQSGSVSYADLCRWCRENFKEKDGFYLLWTNEACVYDAEELEGCEVLYQTKEPTVRGEEYTIYKIPLGQSGKD